MLQHNFVLSNIKLHWSKVNEAQTVMRLIGQENLNVISLLKFYHIYFIEDGQSEVNKIYVYIVLCLVSDKFIKYN